MARHFYPPSGIYRKDVTPPFGLPFQERAEVPDEVWKNINLDEYLESE